MEEASEVLWEEGEAEEAGGGGGREDGGAAV